MVLFVKFRKMLIWEEKRKKKASSQEEDAIREDTSTGDENGMSVIGRNRQGRVNQLTPREKDLYLLLLEGYTLKESAKQLGVKYSTANTHMTGIYKKLEVKSRAELIIKYRLINGGNYDE